MSETGARISTLLLQYWYQLRNAVPMLSSIGSPVKGEEGPAYLFSTSFSPHLVDREFRERFALVPWMTYRKDFVPIEGGYTTDCGWGCMLRSAQMMLAEALIRRECAMGSSVVPKAVREHVLGLFADRPDCPYSIHEMSRRAAKYGRKAGEWFEPTTTLLIVQEMLEERKHADHLRAIVARDGLLDASSLMPPPSMNDGADVVVRSEDDIDPLLRPVSQVPISILVLVPLRLGLRAINTASYSEAVLTCLKFPQSVGLVGGRPSHSLYFCGSQGKKLVFLDPHTVQSAESCVDLLTFQCPEARSISLEEIDPSLALGFLVSSYEDFLDLKMRIETLPGPAMFSISTRPVDFESDVLDMDDDDQGGDDEFEQVGSPMSPPGSKSSAGPMVLGDLSSSGQYLGMMTSSVHSVPDSPKVDLEEEFTEVTRMEAVKPPSPPKKKEEFVFL